MMSEMVGRVMNAIEAIPRIVVRHNKMKDDFWYEVVSLPEDGDPIVEVSCRTNEIAANECGAIILERQALAAIAAMREPTADQGLAMFAAWDAFGEDATMGPEEAIAIYRAAMDAALGDK